MAESDSRIPAPEAWKDAPPVDPRQFDDRYEQATVRVRNPAHSQATTRGLDVFRAAALANLGTSEFHWLKHMISEDGAEDALFPVAQDGPGCVQVTWQERNTRCSFSLSIVLGPRQELVPDGILRFIPVQLIDGPNGQKGVYLNRTGAYSRPVTARDRASSVADEATAGQSG